MATPNIVPRATGEGGLGTSAKKWGDVYANNVNGTAWTTVTNFVASKAAASGLASLDSGSLVVQNPANATATATASKIPIADAAGTLNSWVGPVSDNLIIDGNFDFWLEGTSQTSSGYGSDTMWNNSQTTSTKTHSRQSFAVGETEGFDAPAKYYSRTVVTTGNTSGSSCTKRQSIEDVRTIAGRTVTLSFWAKADTNRNIAIEFYQYFGTGGSPSAAVAGIGAQKFAITSTWAKYTATIEIPSISGKTIGSDENSRHNFHIWLDAGSDLNSRTASLGCQSGTFDLAQIKLEYGSTYTKFRAPDLTEELKRINRYYFSGYVSGQTPGQSNAVDLYSATAASTTNFQGISAFFLPVVMRTTPTTTVYSSITGTAARAYSYNASADVVVANYTTDRMIKVYSSGTFTAGHLYGLQLVADARL